MTERISAILVHLEEDMRIDDAEALLEAFRCFRNVAKVETNTVGSKERLARERAKIELRRELWEVLGGDNR